MKALILSGGTGSRFRNLLHTYPKQLLPILGKPLIFYGIESIVNTGIKEVGIVVADKEKKVANIVGDGKRWNIQIKYIKQKKPEGLAHAVKISRSFLKDDKFLMWLGDTLIMEDFRNLINCFEKQKPNALLLLGKVSNPNVCGIAEVKNKKIIKVNEKPKNTASNLAIAGLYVFDGCILKAVENIEPSQRGELEITDAIQYLIDNSYKVLPYVTRKSWIDVGDANSYLKANLLLDKKL